MDYFIVEPIVGVGVRVGGFIGTEVTIDEGNEVNLGSTFAAGTGAEVKPIKTSFFGFY